MRAPATAPGVVLASDVTPRPESSSAYGMWIVYEYTVGQDRFVNDRIYALGGETVYSCLPACELAGRYAPGAEITVYYDPGNPRRAYLEEGASPAAATAFAALAIIGGTVLLAYLASTLLPLLR